MTITAAACPSEPPKEKAARSDWFWLQAPAFALGSCGAVWAVLSGHGRALGGEDLDATQRGVTPGAPVQGNSLDRNEVPLLGAGVDQGQNKGRARHGVPAVGWRTIMVMLAFPRVHGVGVQTAGRPATITTSAVFHRNIIWLTRA